MDPFRDRDNAMDRPAAEALAIRALGYLAAESERLVAFLGATGLGPGTLRAAAQEPSFLIAVLDHLLADDDLVRDFATRLAIAPETVAEARALIAGSPPG